MKRFTETRKWDDPWFRKLTPEHKLLWQWLLDGCDNAGVIDPDIDLASFQIGYQYPIDTLSVFAGRVIPLAEGKHFIPKFIEFQYGTLSADCKAHNPIFISLRKHGLEGYPKGINTLQEKEKEKEKEKDKSGTKSKARGTLSEMMSFAVEIGLLETDGESMYNHWEANGWKNGSNPVKNWQAGIRKWKSQGWLPSQKTNGHASHPPKPHRAREYPQEALDLPD
jgi:hypothetical protein